MPMGEVAAVINHVRGVVEGGKCGLDVIVGDGG